MLESISTLALFTVVALFPIIVFGYAVAAVALPTAWQLDHNAISLRCVALLFIPVQIALSDINWIRFGSGIFGGYAALKLDGRYLFCPHVTIHRNGGITGLVRFTPKDLNQLAAALAPRLERDPGWRRTAWGWERVRP
jgi:hypothetical protein